MYSSSDGTVKENVGARRGHLVPYTPKWQTYCNTTGHGTKRSKIQIFSLINEWSRERMFSMIGWLQNWPNGKRNVCDLQSNTYTHAYACTHIYTHICIHTQVPFSAASPCHLCIRINISHSNPNSVLNLSHMLLGLMPPITAFLLRHWGKTTQVLEILACT
jgi:hypothetical protein